MIIPREIEQQISKERENFWGQFKFFDEKINKKMPPLKWIIDQEAFWDYGHAVNLVIKTIDWGKNLSLKDIQEISRNDKIEKVCGKRPPAFAMLYFPFELGYSCPICSKPVREMDLDNEYESLRLDWSEYKNHMYCRRCNIDIPSFLCAGVQTKRDVLFYEKIFLEMINEIKAPLEKIIGAKSRAYQNLKEHLKNHQKSTIDTDTIIKCVSIALTGTKEHGDILQACQEAFNNYQIQKKKSKKSLIKKIIEKLSKRKELRNKI